MVTENLEDVDFKEDGEEKEMRSVSALRLF